MASGSQQNSLQLSHNGASSIADSEQMTPSSVDFRSSAPVLPSFSSLGICDIFITNNNKYIGFRSTWYSAETSMRPQKILRFSSVLERLIFPPFPQVDFCFISKPENITALTQH